MVIDLSTQHQQPAAIRTTLLRVAVLSSFLPPFMGSALNIALPDIGRDFSLSAVMVGWVNSIYLLTTVVALVPIGRIADIYGRRRIFLLGMLVYTVTCLLCAVAPSAEILIIARGLLGIGAAMIFGTITAMLTSVFPVDQRGRVLGINIASVYVGLSSGPVLGGFMTEYLGWRSIFMANIPIGIWVAWVVHRKLKQEWADARGEDLDVPGMLLYGLALFALMYGLSRIPDNLGLVLSVIGTLSLIGFILMERRIPYPVLNISLFVRNRVFMYSNLAALIHYSATFAIGFLLSLYFQLARDLSAAVTGLILIAQPLVQALFSPLAGTLSDRLEPRVVASSGMAVTCVGLIALIPIHFDTAIWQIVVILCMLGLGFAFFASPNTNAIMSSVDKSRYGLAAGALATMRQIGQMLSMTLTMLVFSLFFGSAPLSKAQAPRLLVSIRVLLVVMVALCIAGIFASLARGNSHESGASSDSPSGS